MAHGLEADPVTVTVFLLLFVGIAGAGLIAARWRRGDLSQLAEWGLGGRRFGTLITWFLLGGDLYTAYTFIAVPALMFGAGATGYFAIPYGMLAYPLLFVGFARLWSVAHRHGYVTAADFVRGRFGSRSLALASWFIVQGVVHSSVDRWYRSVPAWFFEHQFRYEFLVVFLVATPVTVLLAHLWLRWKRFTLDLSPTFVSWSFAALLLAVLWGGVAPVRWLLEPRYEVRDASRVIEALPLDAVVAGTWAPLLTLDSGRRGLVIWPRLNNVRPIETHGITHLLLQRGSSEDLPNNRVRITNCYNLRYWGTSRGLGELIHGPLNTTKYDFYGTVECDVIAAIAVVSGW